MADSFTPTLNLRKPEVGAAFDTWGGAAGLNADLDLLDGVFLTTGLSTVAPPAGHPLAGVPGVGLRIGKGMVLNVEGQVQHKDPTDITKVGTFSMDLIPTATTVDMKFPAAGGTIATVDQVRTMMPVGTILHGYYGNTPPPGFVFADGRTIGDASSGATNRANADTAALFARFWGFSATQFPIQNADGTAATRGADAATDFAAHRRITLPDHSGAAAAGRDNLSGTSRGRLSAVMASTTHGVFSGQSQVQYAIDAGTFSGTGTAFTNGQAVSPETANAGAVAGGDGPYAVHHAHTIVGNASVTVSGNTSGTLSDTRTNVQPTVICDVVIAL